MYKGTREWEQGRAGEMVARRWLAENGWFVIPAADIDGRSAPLLAGRYKTAVLPDLIASLKGESRWVEVKTKAKPTLYRKTNKFEHGIGLKNWNDYLEVQEVTGIPGHLAILERSSGLLLIASFDNLKRRSREYHGTAMDGQPHIFFQRDAFEFFDYRNAEWDVQPIEPTAIRTLTQPEAPTYKQTAMF